MKTRTIEFAMLLAILSPTGLIAAEPDFHGPIEALPECGAPGDDGPACRVSAATEIKPELETAEWIACPNGTSFRNHHCMEVYAPVAGRVLAEVGQIRLGSRNVIAIIPAAAEAEPQAAAAAAAEVDPCPNTLFCHGEHTPWTGAWWHGQDEDRQTSEDETIGEQPSETPEAPSQPSTPSKPGKPSKPSKPSHPGKPSAPENCKPGDRGHHGGDRHYGKGGNKGYYSDARGVHQVDRAKGKKDGKGKDKGKGKSGGKAKR